MAEEFGRFELLKRLGGGTTADVFLARQKGLTGFEKFIAIKALAPSLADNDEFVALFLDEARLASRLNHPNVCRTYDLGIEGNRLFMAMEYVHGVDLAHLQAELGELETMLPVSLAVRVAAEVAAGLHHAHELADEKGRCLGIVHRDVTPSNVLLTFEGGVKLGGFGLARAMQRLNRSQGTSTKGHLAYMAPEQLNQQGTVDRRSDVFSLGIVLYEMLSGKRLFLRPGDVETLAAVFSAPIPAPSKLNDEVPASLDEVVLKALARDPTARFHSAQALQLALESWLRDTRDPSTSVHLAKFVRQLYAERVEIERTKGILWDVPAQLGAHPTRPSPTSPRQRARRDGSSPSRARVEVTAPSSPVLREVTEEVTRTDAVATNASVTLRVEARRSVHPRVLKVWAAGVIAFLLLAGLAAMIVS